ncbi:MAG TPA: GDSL-type esterase/lipase family protein [Patescibacteria group bacterium]|nr:GDSL-type esterase/lipase family protein [Patescibacteria group bacterium]
MIGFICTKAHRHLLFVLFFLSACSKTAIVELPEEEFKGTNVFIGDSHVAGWEVREYYAGKSLGVYGVGGERIRHIQTRLEKFVIGSADNCFIIAGTNDFVESTRDLQLSLEEMLDRMLAAYSRLLDSASVRFEKVYMISLFPIGQAVNPDYSCQRCIEAYQAINIVNDSLQTRIARDYQNVFFINVTPILADSKGYFINENTSDGIHLSSRGYDILSSKVNPYVR